MTLSAMNDAENKSEEHKRLDSSTGESFKEISVDESDSGIGTLTENKSSKQNNNDVLTKSEDTGEEIEKIHIVNSDTNIEKGGQENEDKSAHRNDLNDDGDKSEKNTCENRNKKENSCGVGEKEEGKSGKKLGIEKKTISDITVSNRLGDENDVSGDVTINENKMGNGKTSEDYMSSEDEISQIKKFINSNIPNEENDCKSNKTRKQTEEEVSEHSLSTNINQVTEISSPDFEDDEKSLNKPTRTKLGPKRKRIDSGNSSSDNSEYTQELKRLQPSALVSKMPLLKLKRCEVSTMDISSILSDSPPKKKKNFGVTDSGAEISIKEEEITSGSEEDFTARNKQKAKGMKDSDMFMENDDGNNKSNAKINNKTKSTTKGSNSDEDTRDSFKSGKSIEKQIKKNKKSKTDINIVSSDSDIDKNGSSVDSSEGNKQNRLYQKKNADHESDSESGNEETGKLKNNFKKKKQKAASESDSDDEKPRKYKLKRKATLEAKRNEKTVYSDSESECEIKQKPGPASKTNRQKCGSVSPHKTAMGVKPRRGRPPKKSKEQNPLDSDDSDDDDRHNTKSKRDSQINGSSNSEDESVDPKDAKIKESSNSEDEEPARKTGKQKSDNVSGDKGAAKVTPRRGRPPKKYKKQTPSVSNERPKDNDDDDDDMHSAKSRMDSQNRNSSNSEDEEPAKKIGGEKSESISGDKGAAVVKPRRGRPPKKSKERTPSVSVDRPKDSDDDDDNDRYNANSKMDSQNKNPSNSEEEEPAKKTGQKSNMISGDTGAKPRRGRPPKKYKKQNPTNPNDISRDSDLYDTKSRIDPQNENSSSSEDEFVSPKVGKSKKYSENEPVKYTKKLTNLSKKKGTPNSKSVSNTSKSKPDSERDSSSSEDEETVKNTSKSTNLSNKKVSSIKNRKSVRDTSRTEADIEEIDISSLEDGKFAKNTHRSKKVSRKGELPSSDEDKKTPKGRPDSTKRKNLKMDSRSRADSSSESDEDFESTSKKKIAAKLKQKKSYNSSDSEDEKLSIQHSQHTFSSSDLDESDEKTKSKAKISSKKTLVKKEPKSSGSESDTSYNVDKKKRKSLPENNPRIISLKRYLKFAGIRVRNFSKLWENCNTLKSKADALLGLLEKEGLKGRPTIAKCKKLRKKIETRNEVRELDVGNIVEESGGSSSTNDGETISPKLPRPKKNAIMNRKKDTGNLNVDELQRRVLIEQLRLLKLQRVYYEMKLKESRKTKASARLDPRREQD